MHSTRSSRVVQQQPREMLEKAHLHETFFSLKGVRDRPLSTVSTEFMESDYGGDDDDILSEPDDGESSPRDSLKSAGQPSFTTLSSYDEVQTPRSSRAPTAFRVEADKPVEGPKGPHLFRNSALSANFIEFQNALSLSPITPKVSGLPQTEFQLPIRLDLTSLPTRRRQSGPFRFTDEELDTATLAAWSPEKVAQWMLNAGVELPIAEKFVENDITGGILITLKFEDLKELGIPSFGVRTKIWEEIHVMRNIQPSEPAPETPIEDEPDRAVRRELRKNDGDGGLKRRQSSRRRKQKPEDIISPLESVSIVGIEQMMPKPHHCSKGENCAKWRRNQRMIEAFKKDHPFVDMDKGGVIMVAGDPGNPATAPSLKPVVDDLARPVSDVVPSVVASSDVMGPGSLPPLQYLQEAALRNLQARDPQDNVRHFLDFQHQHVATSSEVPPTPPFETGQRPPHEGLRSLPRLSIPGQATRLAPKPASAHALSAAPTPPQAYNPYYQVAVESPSPDEATPTAVYRFGTPFTDMDVPVTAVPVGPVARDFSQSVPPDMNFRSGPAPPSRSMSRSSARRPSFQAMPPLTENMVTPIAPRLSPRASARITSQRPIQPPPRVQYPWTPADRAAYERAIAPVSATTPLTAIGTPSSAMSQPTPLSSQGSGMPAMSKEVPDGVAYQGHMKKRKTKMLRHEWHEHYFTLKGTRLNMHNSVRSVDRTLEYIDVDDYAIMCSSLATGSRLNAAFKAMNIKRGADKDKADVAAFAFQLIPQDARGGVRLHKRNSTMPSAATSATAPPPGDGVNGTGKTHHFAVRNRDERIDWMRELMLAKALRQKGEGFEVSVNGNMI